MRAAALAALVAALGSSARAGDHQLHSFERIHLAPEFVAEGAAVGDVDGDGRADLVAGPYWYAGPKFLDRREFAPVKSFSIEGYSDNFVAHLHDLNGDGRQDILIVGFPGAEAYWYENPGESPGHWPRHLLYPRVSNESPAFVDLNGDDCPELLLCDQNHIGFATADRKHPTAPWEFHALSDRTGYEQFTHGLGAGDVNGDGRLDILEKNGWWEQPQADAFSAAWEFHPVPFADAGGAQMHAFDVDGDGDNDVVTSLAAHAYGLAWYEQTSEDGAIKFLAHRIMGETPAENRYGTAFSQLHAVEVADIDGDGVQDVVTGKRFWAHGDKDPGSLDPAVLYWFRTVRGDDGVDFVPYQIDLNSGVGTQFTIADVNSDGFVDIAVSNKKGTFLHLHHVKDATDEEWRDAQPRAVTTKAKTVAAKIDANAAKPGGSPADKPAEFLAQGPDGRTLNLDFEQGDLRDWSATGDAFNGQPIWGDTVRPRRGDSASGHLGDRWVGTYERAGDGPQGTLTSAAFKLAHPFVSFFIGGGSQAETRVELVDEESGEVIVKASGYDSEQLRPVSFDVSKHQGRNAFLRIVDASSGPWGHVNFDHFRLHDERPQISAMESRILKQDQYPHAGLAAQAAVEAMTLPPGFRATVFASEPDVKQPIAMALDDRGRLWIAEAYEYPRRAPEGQGRDRILIFTDADGDGKFDERKVFAEGLNLVSGLEVGFGGVWVGAAPYLLFIPDRNGDDVPDGKPEILLDGWGYQDTHETLNAFIWGPDGWLYGCHGVFTHSLVGKPGARVAERTPLNAAIWRYHPTRHEFEAFANGTSNPWGVDFTDRGEAVCTACVIPHLFHMIKGGRYHRQAGTHFNPYTYDDIKTIADHRHYLGETPHSGNDKSDDAGGGHAHAGAMVYLGGAWPAEYRDRIFMNNIHGQRLNVDILEPQGSGLVGRHGDDFLLTGDRASQMLNLRYGPDGQAYVIDWYDMQACHDGNADVHDRSNGRIYKVVHGDPQPTVVDLAKATDGELAEQALNANDWYVRHARRLLQERAGKGPIDATAVARLKQIAFEHADETRRLRAAWALHGIGELHDAELDKLFADASPYVRAWAIQLAFDRSQVDRVALAARLAQFAAEDDSPVVRLAVASALQELEPAARWDAVDALLAHGEDANDHNLPLMDWYAAEPLAEVDPARALRMALAHAATAPVVRDFMIRRIGAIDSAEVRNELILALRDAGDAETQNALLSGLRTALKGRPHVEKPAAWDEAYSALESSTDPAIRFEATALGVTFGDARSIASFRALAVDADGAAAQRKAAVESLLEGGDAGLADTLISLLTDPEMRSVALNGLARYDAAETPTAILAVYDALPRHEKRQALATLASRAAYGMALLDAIAADKVPRADLSADLARQLLNLRDDDVAERLNEVWGTMRSTPEDKAEQIAKYRQLVTSAPPELADPILGRGVFTRTCQACHTLYGVGASIGPDLTGSNRADLDYLLGNIVDPSALIAKEYQTTVIFNDSGRVFSGVISAEDDHSVTLRNATETIAIPKDEIEERSLSELSLMPENQLQQFTDEEIVSLVAYLRGKSQVPLLASADGAPPLFNGVDLTGWHGNETLWSVEDGELVGRTTTGIAENEFLVSELAGDDFELSCEVKLVDNAGNSGIQFRSERRGEKDVAGYQADVGAGWWGKLYEEHGRELLWTKSGDEHVRPGEWNTYVVRAEGSKIQTWINGQPCVDLDDPAGRRRGVFALQLHSGGPTEVRFRKLVLNPLTPKPAP